MRALRRHEPQNALAIVGREFAGGDLDPCAVWLGNAVLAAELLPIWAAPPDARRRPIAPVLHVRDGLDSGAGVGPCKR